MAPARKLSQKMQHALPLAAVVAYVGWVASDRFGAHLERRKELDEEREATAKADAARAAAQAQM